MIQVFKMSFILLFKYGKAKNQEVIAIEHIVCYIHGSQEEGHTIPWSGVGKGESTKVSQSGGGRYEGGDKWPRAFIAFSTGRNE